MEKTRFLPKIEFRTYSYVNDLSCLFLHDTNLLPFIENAIFFTILTPFNSKIALKIVRFKPLNNEISLSHRQRGMVKI